MSEEEPAYDEHELEEAKQLAAALDARSAARGAALTESVSEALEAAEVVALLRAPELAPARSTVVQAQIEQRLARARRRKRAGWLAASGALAVAAAALLMVNQKAQDAPESKAAPTSPNGAQSEPAAGSATSLAEAARVAAIKLSVSQVGWLEAPSPRRRELLEDALRGYRQAVLAELEARTP